MNNLTRSRLIFDLKCALDSSTNDWFTCQLFRLIAKADISNRNRIRLCFRDEVEIYEAWQACTDEKAFFNGALP